MKNCLKRFLSIVLSAAIMLSSIVFVNATVVMASSSYITEESGWFESVYAEWTAVEGAVGYKAYVKGASESDSAYEQLDNELIRQYSNYWRVDAVGLAAGDYVLKIVPVTDEDGTEGTAIVSSTLTATAYDRSGFAHSSGSTFGTASGAYNDDGTLKSNAKVFYVTSETAKTISTDIITSSKGATTTYTGFQNIINGKQKGYDTTPFVFRIIGTIEDTDMDAFLSSAEGLQIKGNKSYSEMNITIEGIGEDAAIRGFGMLLRNCGNVELRNFAVMNCMDDCISMDTDNCNIWVHNIDFFYGQAGSASDQAKGDGTVDIKDDSQYITVAYNHFYDSGKSSLCGMKSESGPNYITYHHNWFDHSDSRHPRIRTMSVHVYNNYFDGNSKYGVGVTTGGSAFVESNVFESCKYPMMSSQQGTDAMGDGTFSGENGGIIKAYNNSISSATSYITQNTSSTSFDAVEVSSREAEVSSSYTALVGGTTYDNSGLAVSNLNATPEDVKTVVSTVTSYAGRMNGGDFFESTGTSKSSYTGLTTVTSSDVDTALKAAIASYTSQIVSIGGLASSSSGSETTTSSGSDATTETTTSSSSDATTETTTSDVEVSEGDYIHNFTTNGKTSSFYSITGNLSIDKATPSAYSALTQCLKMESSTSITFTAPYAGTLTLITTSDSKQPEIKLDNESYSVSADGAVTIDISAGAHEIKKDSSSTYLYYMEYAPSDDGDTTTTTTEASSETTSEEASSETTTSASSSAGDVNKDGSVDELDADIVLKVVAGIITDTSEYDMDAADCDGIDDVTILDAVWILNYAADNSYYDFEDEPAVTLDGTSGIVYTVSTSSSASESDGLTAEASIVTYNGSKALYLNDVSATDTVKVTLPLTEKSSGTVTYTATVTPSAASTNWTLMQLNGVKADSSTGEVLGVRTDSSKAYGLRVNAGSTVTSSGVVSAADTQAVITIVVDFDNDTASISVDGGTAVTVTDVDAQSITSMSFQTATSERDLYVDNAGITASSTSTATTTEATTETTTEASGSSYVQNFTSDGTSSTFYTISGNLSTSKGTVTYNGLTLTQCLKMETETSITFTAPSAGTLTMVFNAFDTSCNCKIDGTKYTADSDGILTVDLEAGSHTITKADSSNLFYMVFTAN